MHRKRRGDKEATRGPFFFVRSAIARGSYLRQVLIRRGSSLRKERGRSRVASYARLRSRIDQSAFG